MNKTDLINVVYINNPDIQKKDIEQIVNSVFDTVASCIIDGERVQINGFGAFEVTGRMKRMGRNVRTGETVVLPAKKVPVFRPSRTFRERVSTSD